MTVQTVQLVKFTGRTLEAWGTKINATCVVRNAVNGWRKPEQVVRTFGSTHPNGLPYQPERFPPGVWEITRVADMGPDTVYWPAYIDTEATQQLPIWELDDRGRYLVPSDHTITGRGYGIHHARYHCNDAIIPSSTTLGCINILSPEDAQWFGEEIRKALGYRLHVFLEVPEWDEWEVA